MRLIRTVPGQDLTLYGKQLWNQSLLIESSFIYQRDHHSLHLFFLSVAPIIFLFLLKVYIYRAFSRPWIFGATLAYGMMVSLYYFCSAQDRTLAEYFKQKLDWQIISYPNSKLLCCPVLCNSIQTVYRRIMLESLMEKKEEINETSVIINKKLFRLIKGKFWNLKYL